MRLLVFRTELAHQLPHMGRCQHALPSLLTLPLFHASACASHRVGPSTTTHGSLPACTSLLSDTPVVSCVCLCSTESAHQLPHMGRCQHAPPFFLTLLLFHASALLHRARPSTTTQWSLPACTSLLSDTSVVPCVCCAPQCRPINYNTGVIASVPSFFLTLSSFHASACTSQSRPIDCHA